MPFAGWPAISPAVSPARSARRGIGLVLALVMAATGLVVAQAQGTMAQSGPTAAERCSEFHLFGAEPVDVAKTADNQTVLAQVSWGWNETIGCYLVLDDATIATLRADGQPVNQSQAPTEVSQRCFDHHRFGASPVDVAKTADGNTVLAQLSWGWHDSIGCYLTLNSAALDTLRAAASQAGTTVPGFPRNVEATAGASQITVTWAAPFNDGGAAITGYTVAYEPNAANCPADASAWNAISASETSATITGLDNGVQYRVCVSANNQVGNSGWTGASATPQTTPSAPRNLEATASTGLVSVSWAAPFDDGGDPITSYTLVYKANAADCPAAFDSTWGVRTTTSTTASIDALSNNVSYRICVRASNTSGDSGWTSTTSSPSDRPGRPTNVFFVDNSPTSLTVAWTAPADAGASAITSYTINWCTATANDVCASAWSTSSSDTNRYNITGLSGNTNYGVRVQAVNNHGNSDWSTTQFASTRPTAVPGVPTNLNVDANNRQLVLQWSASSPNGAPIIHYIVECRLAGEASAVGSCGSRTWSVHGSISGTSATITGLANGIEYDVRVSALNSVGRGSWATASGTPAVPPGVPTNVVATTSGRNIAVTWTAPPSGGAPITRYTVEYCSRTCASWQATSVSGNPPATSTTLTSLSAGTTYSVRVRAFSSVGESDWSTTHSATTPIRPDAPTGLIISSIGRSQFLAGWTAPVSTTGISQYDVQYCVSRPRDDGTWSCSGGWTNAGPVASTSLLITGLTGNTSYNVRVRALNNAGASDWSSIYTATTNAPEVPGIIADLDGTVSNRSVRLSWTAPDDNGARITRYTVQCRDDSNAVASGTCSADAFADFRTLAGTSITVTGLTNGNQYSFQVKATNSVGDTPWSNVFTATPATRPGPPTDIEFINSYPGNGRANISIVWTAPEDSGGSATGITGYTVEFRTGGGGWSFVSFDPAPAATITGLALGTRYTVRIRTHTAVGESNWVQASSTPTGAPSAPAAPSLDAVGRGDMVFSWGLADPGESEVTDYQVQWCTSRERTTTDADGVETITYPCTGSWRTAPDDDITDEITSYQITDLNGGTRYSARVRAENEHGFGEWSEIVSAETESPGAPDTPDDLEFTPRNSQLQLTWTAPLANGARITRYTVECRDANAAVTTGSCRDDDWAQFRTTSATSLTISGLVNGAVYDVRIKATNSAGDSAWAQLNGLIPATLPERVDVDTIEFFEEYPPGGGANLQVTWLEPDDVGGSPVTGYSLQYRPNGGNWSFAYFGLTPQYTISGIAIGTRYDVQIRTHNEIGESGWAQASRTATGRPGQVIGVTLDGVSAVTWSDPVNTGASAITSYNIQRCTARSTTSQGVTTWRCSGGWISAGTATAPPHTLSGLTNGDHLVRVQAVNSYGTGPWSDNLHFSYVSSG